MNAPSKKEKIRIVVTVFATVTTVIILCVLLYYGFLYKRQALQDRFQELHNIVSEQELGDSSSNNDATSAQDKSGDVSADTSGTLSWKIFP